MARTRIVGTVEEAIAIEERLLGRKLPLSFKLWLLENNGLELDYIHIYPVRDERDTRKTWESLAYNLNNEWAEWTSSFSNELFRHLLPFADFRTGDFFCFDYSVNEMPGEWPVVLWSHESGKSQFYASDFNAWKSKILDEASGYKPK